MAGLRELLRLRKRKQRTLEIRHVENAIVKRVEVHDQIPISYPVQQCCQLLKDPMKYLQHPDSSYVNMKIRRQRIIKYLEF